jgi:hypothetical protein
MANDEMGEWLPVLLYRGLFPTAPERGWLDFPAHWLGLDGVSIDR